MVEGERERGIILTVSSPECKIMVLLLDAGVYFIPLLWVHFKDLISFIYLNVFRVL